MLVKFGHPLNKPLPRLVTLFGMVMLLKLVHPLNAEFPMLVKLLGKETSV